MNPANALKDQKSHINSLRAAIIILILMCCYLYIQGQVKPDDITVHFAPDVAAQKQGQVPDAYVYGFAMGLVEQLNEWPNSGTVDYERKINDFSCYMTPNYRNWLNKTLARRANSAKDILQIDELNRIRYASPIEPYKPLKVRNIGNGVWHVWLDIRIKESVPSGNGKEETPVKDVMIRYPVQVVWDGRNCNPAKLSIDGFFSSPERLGGAL